MALRSSGVTDVDPISLEEPWLERPFPLVEHRAKELQQEYDRLLDFR